MLSISPHRKASEVFFVVQKPCTVPIRPPCVLIALFMEIVGEDRRSAEEHSNVSTVIRKILIVKSVHTHMNISTCITQLTWGGILKSHRISSTSLVGHSGSLPAGLLWHLLPPLLGGTQQRHLCPSNLWTGRCGCPESH